MKWILDLFNKQCSHLHARWKFSGYHTAYRNSSSQNFDAVHIRETGYCPKCSKNLFRHAVAPIQLTKLFFDNFNLCMSEEPAVIARRNREKV
jgi:hypothetical protein